MASNQPMVCIDLSRSGYRHSKTVPLKLDARDTSYANSAPLSRHSGDEGGKVRRVIEAAGVNMLMDCRVIRIHLKTAKKNDRMDICSGYLKMVRNCAIIIDTFFETINIFPESFSNHEVQSCMQRNSYRTFPSLHKCICSLNQQNQNVVLVNTKCAYAMEETDCLVKILLDLSNKYKNVIDFEYDAVKNCLQDKNTLENGQEDVSVKHTDNFESMVDSGNTICQNQEKNNTMQKRQKVLKPRKLDENKYFPDLNKINSLNSNPIFRTHDNNPAILMAIVNSPMDLYSLCEANGSLGDIVYDGEGPASAVPQPQPSHQTNTRNVALPNTTVSNDNPTQGRRLEESSNSESVPSSNPSAHEQRGNQQNFIPNEVATDGTSVLTFTAEDRIRCPRYQAYPVRLSTFTKWPSDLTQKPEHVAQAGFYYTGLQDVVRCFACDGGLKNWDPEDDPWIEHARWFPLCPFVQKVKGQEFVELVRRMTEESDEEEDAVVHSTFQSNNPMAHPPDLQQLNLTNDTDESSPLDTDAAQSVLQTGYPKSTVAIAVEELIRKDKRKFTSQDIMDVILEKEDKGELLPKDGRSELPQILSQNFRSTQSTTEDMRAVLRENESLKSIVTCMKCKVQSRNTLFLPCTHHCLCEDCAEKCSLCPVCYKIINKKIKTFMI